MTSKKNRFKVLDSLHSKHKGKGRGGQKISGKMEEGGLGSREGKGALCRHAIVFFIYKFAGERKNPIG